MTKHPYYSKELRAKVRAYHWFCCGQSQPKSVRVCFPEHSNVWCKCHRQEGSYAIPIDSYAEPERMDSYAKPMDAVAAGCCCCRLLLGIRCCWLLKAAAAAAAAGWCCCCCCWLLLLLMLQAAAAAPVSLETTCIVVFSEGQKR